MELVLDANILFAALIKESHTRHLILNGPMQLYAPEFLLEQMEAHLNTLTSKTGLSHDQLRELLIHILVFGNVHI